MARTTGNASDLITFTRASTGTFLGSNGLLQTAAINTPRVEYDANGVAKGLLIEEARTNLVLNSEAPGNIYGTYTVNSTTSPLGSVSAALLQPTGSGLKGWAPYYTGFSANTDYTLSVFIKAKELSQIAINLLSTSGPTFDALTGQLTSGTGTITDVGNGWYRCTAVHQTNAGGVLDVRLLILDNFGNSSYTSNGTDGIYIWGFQVEQGSFPTSYIPTSGATATRSADIASVSVSEFGYNQAQGSVVVECQSLQTTAANPMAYQLNDGTVSNRITVFGSGGGWRFVTTTSGTAQADINISSSFNSGSFNKIASSFAANQFNHVVNGESGVEDVSGSLPTITTLSLGTQILTNQINGHIKSINYYPLRLSDAKLQELTS